MPSPIKRWTDVYIALFEQRILLVAGAVIASAVIISDRVAITNLERKLREKEYILAPGVTDFAKVTPGIISKDYVREFAESIAATLGSFSAKEVERRYQELEKYLSSDFRLTFREKTKKDLGLFASTDVAETFSANSSEIEEAPNGFRAAVFGTQTRYVSGLKVYEGAHVIVFLMVGLAPSASTPWALQITDISRLSEEEFRKQQRSMK